MKKYKLTKLDKYKLKEFFDFITATIILILTLPIIISMILHIKIVGNSTIFKKEKCVGRYGRVFNKLTFNVLQENKTNKIYNRALDKYSKTNLPKLANLLNVLSGDMSILGTSCENISVVKSYNDEDLKILLVKPAIISTASKFNDINLRKKENIRYIKNFSLKGDMVTLIKYLYINLKNLIDKK